MISIVTCTVRLAQNCDDNIEHCPALQDGRLWSSEMAFFNGFLKLKRASARFAAIVFLNCGSPGVSLSVRVTLVVAGIAQGIGAHSYRKRSGILIVADLWLIGGGYLLMRPLERVFALTFVVATIFLGDGF